MNEDVLVGQWRQMRGELKTWWGKIAYDDLDRLGGRREKLVGLVQEAYGYTRDYAAREVGLRLKEFGEKTGGTLTAQDLGATANQTREAATISTEKIASVARVIWENAPDNGAAAGATSAVAQGRVSRSYLSDKQFDHLAKDVTNLTRVYQVQSLLIGVGLGVLLARCPK